MKYIILISIFFSQAALAEQYTYTWPHKDRFSYYVIYLDWPDKNNFVVVDEPKATLNLIPGTHNIVVNGVVTGERGVYEETIFSDQREVKSKTGVNHESNNRQSVGHSRRPDSQRNFY